MTFMRKEKKKRRTTTFPMILLWKQMVRLKTYLKTYNEPLTDVHDGLNGYYLNVYSGNNSRVSNNMSGTLDSSNAAEDGEEEEGEEEEDAGEEEEDGDDEEGPTSGKEAPRGTKRKLEEEGESGGPH